MSDDSIWTEGMCGDGAAILRDGVMVPIEEVVALLNYYTANELLAEDEMRSDALERACRLLGHGACTHGEVLTAARAYLAFLDGTEPETTSASQ